MDKKHGQHYTCDLCGNFFGTNESLKVHNNQNHNKNVNSCESEYEEITKINSKEVKKKIKMKDAIQKNNKVQKVKTKNSIKSMK